MEARHLEWSELEARAAFLLEHPAELPGQEELGRCRCELRLWHHPSFDPYTVWSIYQSRKDEQHSLLNQVVWDRPNDVEQMFNPMEGLKQGFHTTPTLRAQTVKILREGVKSRMAELERISLPAFVQNHPFGLDGETFGIASGTGFVNAQVSWWEEGPTEWQELVNWFHDTTRYFSAYLE